MQSASAVVEQVAHPQHILAVAVLAVIRLDGLLQPTQSQWEQVELALLPQQMEQWELPHNMEWSLLAVEGVVLLLALEVVQPGQQQRTQLLQFQLFLTQERHLLKLTLSATQAVAVQLELLSAVLAAQGFQLVGVVAQQTQLEQ
jgi:hypothetical protein